MMSNEIQNARLTVAFGTTCICWITLWTPYAIIQAIFQIISLDVFDTDPTTFDNLHILRLLAADLRTVYSTVNPIIFITISTPFKTPLIEILQTVKNKLTNNTTETETHNEM